MKEARGRPCPQCGLFRDWQEFSLAPMHKADETFYSWCRSCVEQFYIDKQVGHFRWTRRHDCDCDQ